MAQTSKFWLFTPLNPQIKIYPANDIILKEYPALPSSIMQKIRNFDQWAQNPDFWHSIPLNSQIKILWLHTQIKPPTAFYYHAQSRKLLETIFMSKTHILTLNPTSLGKPGVKNSIFSKYGRILGIPKKFGSLP